MRPDQLRQRVAFALSRDHGDLAGEHAGRLSVGLRELLRHAGAATPSATSATLMENVTLHPAMGVYLSMLGNQKPDAARNIRPDENYARELMQLFTIGLVELKRDGSVQTRRRRASRIPTYDQEIVAGIRARLHRLDLSRSAELRGRVPHDRQPDRADAGVCRAACDRCEAAAQLSRAPSPASIPAGQTPAAGPRGCTRQHLQSSRTSAPFIAQRLIQRLVTSNPSPQYVERVARKFNDDGSGERGNLAAVVKAHPARLRSARRAGDRDRGQAQGAAAATDAALARVRRQLAERQATTCRTSPGSSARGRCRRRRCSTSSVRSMRRPARSRIRAWSRRKCRSRRSTCRA